MPKSSIRELNHRVKQSLVLDPDHLDFFAPYVSDCGSFLKKAVKKQSTRRMMLRAQWYVKIADELNGAANHDTLRISFLFSMAEGVAKQRVNKPNLDEQSAQYCKDFFDFISPEDKLRMETGIRKTYSSPSRTGRMKIEKIIEFLYSIRCDAIHGREFWGFSLSKKSDGSFERVTFASHGKRNKKRRYILHTNITYHELRDIFVRNAVANIESLF